MIKTKAIVLNRKPYRDYDALVSFYTLDQGYLVLLARGLQKEKSKLAGHLEPFNLVDLMIIKGRERYYIGSAISENSFLNIKSDYQRIWLAGEAISFVQSLSFPEQVDYNIFLTLRDFLLSLDFSSDSAKELLLFFKLKVLEILGYGLGSSSCSFCHSKDDLIFNFFDKEFICRNCAQGQGLSNEYLFKISRKSLNLRDNIINSEFLALQKLSLESNEYQDLETLVNLFKRII